MVDDDDFPEDDDATLIYRALSGYANWIETEEFVLSAVDAEQAGKKHRALGVDQMRLVLRLRELSATFLPHCGSGQRVEGARKR